MSFTLSVWLCRNVRSDGTPGRYTQLARMLPLCAVGLGDALLEHALPTMLVSVSLSQQQHARSVEHPDCSTLLSLLRLAFDHSSWGRGQKSPQDVACLIGRLGLGASEVPNGLLVEAALLGFAATTRATR